MPEQLIGQILIGVEQLIGEILMGVGLFIAGIVARNIQKLADKLEDIRVSLAAMAEKLVQHEGRIDRLEKTKK